MEAINEQLKAWQEQAQKEARMATSQAVRKEMDQPLDSQELHYEAIDAETVSNETIQKWFEGWIREPFDMMGHMQFRGEAVRAREMVSSVLNHLHYTVDKMKTSWAPAAGGRYRAAKAKNMGDEIGLKEFEEAAENLRSTFEQLDLMEMLYDAGRAHYEAQFGEQFLPRTGRNKPANGEDYAQGDPELQKLEQRLGLHMKRHGSKRNAA